MLMSLERTPFLVHAFDTHSRHERKKASIMTEPEIGCKIASWGQCLISLLNDILDQRVSHSGNKMRHFGRIAISCIEDVVPDDPMTENVIRMEMLEHIRVGISIRADSRYKEDTLWETVWIIYDLCRCLRIIEQDLEHSRSVDKVLQWILDLIVKLIKSRVVLRVTVEICSEFISGCIWEMQRRGVLGNNSIETCHADNTSLNACTSVTYLSSAILARENLRETLIYPFAEAFLLLRTESGQHTEHAFVFLIYCQCISVPFLTGLRQQSLVLALLHERHAELEIWFSCMIAWTMTRVMTNIERLEPLWSRSQFSFHIFITLIIGSRPGWILL